MDARQHREGSLFVSRTRALRTGSETGCGKMQTLCSLEHDQSRIRSDRYGIRPGIIPTWIGQGLLQALTAREGNQSLLFPPPVSV